MTVAALPRPDARPLLAWIVLVSVGLGWGSGQLLSKLATTSGFHPLGMAFWQTAIGIVLFTGALLASGQRLPLTRRHLAFYLVCGLIGTALPHTLSFAAIRHLPVGVQSIVLSSVPMMTLLLSLPLGLDRAEPRRLIGLGLGLVAVLIIAAPDAGLPDPDQAAWILLPVLVSLSYAAENVYIARARPAGTGALQVMCGLTWGSALLITPATIAAGGWVAPTGAGTAELALIATSVVHVFCYLGLVWLIGHAGPVFAAQVGYVVTGAGVAWGMVVLGERHSPWVWAALALMLTGLALVRPRRAGAGRGIIPPPSSPSAGRDRP